MKERYLITGSHGFIGEHLAKKLEQQGQKVYRFNRNETRVRQSIYDFNPTAIVHLAAYGNQYRQTDIHEIYKANITLLLDLLYITKDFDYKAFINVGSSSEYGAKDKPMSEHDLLEPVTFYAASKAGGTYLAKAWAEQNKKPIVTVRPFSVYGPGEDAGRFIPTIIRKTRNGDMLDLAPGVHDWIYIDDFIEGLLVVSQNAEKLRGQVVNIGSGVQHSNREVVDAVSEIMDRKIIINETGKMRNYDTTASWVADNAKLRSLGWEPKTSLKQGLISTIKYYEQGK